MGYIYVAETATTRLRAKTTGIAIVFIQGMATVYVYITPQMLNAPAMGMSNTSMDNPPTCLIRVLTQFSLLLCWNRFSHLWSRMVVGARNER